MLTKSEEKTVTRPQTWIPSNGGNLQGPDGNTLGIISESRRFVRQVRAKADTKHRGFQLPTHIVKNTLQHLVDWIDIVYEDENGDRYLYRASPKTWVKKGAPRGDNILLSRRNFDHIYSERDEQFLLGHEVDNTGQTGIGDWA